MNFLEPAKIFEASDNEIIFALNEIMKDWQEDKPAIFSEDGVKSVVHEFNGKKFT